MKRLLDILFSLGALIILTPLLLIISLKILVSDGTPILFRQMRVGQHGRPFVLLKFRTMRNSSNGSPLTLKNDTRITEFGRMLRHWRLDELPQLLNVLYGEMSIVGPRPESPELLALYDEESRSFLQRFKPGLTSVASITFLNESEIISNDTSGRSVQEIYINDIVPVKVALEKDYFARMATLSDIKVILLTVRHLIRS